MSTLRFGADVGSDNDDKLALGLGAGVGRAIEGTSGTDFGSASITRIGADLTRSTGFGDIDLGSSAGEEALAVSSPADEVSTLMGSLSRKPTGGLISSIGIGLLPNWAFVSVITGPLALRLFIYHRSARVLCDGDPTRNLGGAGTKDHGIKSALCSQGILAFQKQRPVIRHGKRISTGCR